MVPLDVFISDPPTSTTVPEKGAGSSLLLAESSTIHPSRPPSRIVCPAETFASRVGG
jgi:hypothetical protein